MNDKTLTDDATAQAAAPAQSAPKTKKTPAVEEVAVVTEPYGELKRLAKDEADKQVAAGKARVATPQDIAIAG